MSTNLPNNFNKGQVSGQHIDYLFYIEGVLVPVQSLAISVQVNQPATLVADIAPFPEGITNLKRNMRVYLFKRMNKESKPRLRFSGVITGHTYNKAFGQRTLKITCASANYKWQTLLVSTMDDKNFTGAAETILNTYKTNLDNNTYANAINKAAEELEAAKKSGDQQQIDRAKQELKLAERNKKAAEGIVESAAKSKSSLTSSLNAMTYLRGGYVQLTEGNLETLSSNIQDDGRTTSMRSALSAVNNGTEPQNFSLSTAFEKAFEKTKDHNFMEALFAIIQDVHLKADPCTVRDYINFRDDILPAYLEIFNPSLTPTNTTNADNDPSLYAFVKREFNNALKGAPSGSPIIIALLSVLESMFLKFSVDPLAMAGQIVFHPMMGSFIPPKCNVIFPNMYSEISIQTNDWQEPTRSFIIFPPFATGGLEVLSSEQQDNGVRSQDVIARTMGILCDTADKFLQQARVKPPVTETSTNNANSDVVDLKAAAKTMQKAMDIVTQDEQEIGVSLNVVQLPHTFMTNMNLNDQVKFANFMHSVAKYSIRQCFVRGCIVDDLAVGMPILILDGLYSIHGTLENMQYSISSEGDYGCSLTIGYPKFVLLDEHLEAPPLWLKDIEKKGSVTAIGEAYKKQYGCGSVYDDSGESFNPESDTDTVILAKLTAKLLNDFNANPERWSFTEEYRKRNELTTDDVFGENLYKCTASSTESTKDDNRVLQYTGGAFSPYTVTEYQNSETQSLLSSKGLTYDKVNKPEKVNQYLNKIYQQGAGVTSGILANDTGLDDTRPFEVNVKNKD